MNERLGAALSSGPILLDAAMGTRLIARGLDLSHDDPALWNLDHPQDVADVHRGHVQAGAVALLTNTFGANSAFLERFGRSAQVETLNRRAVELARAAAGPERLVIGSIGPTAVDRPGAVRMQGRSLENAGVDALILETHTADQAEWALQELLGGAVPVLVSLVCWPPNLAAVVRCLTALGAAALGGNCQSGMVPALRMAAALRRETDLPLLVKPSAGLPGETPASPQSFTEAVPSLRELGVRLFGGCCGTTDEHVAALRAGLLSCP